MSAEPSNPSGLPGRNRPQLSDLSRETTEDDLWNLDDETAAPRQRPQKLTPPPAAGTSSPAEEPVTELEAPAPAAEEPTQPRGVTPKGKPLAPRPSQQDEIGDLDEGEDEGEPGPAVAEQPAPKKAPEPAAPAKTAAAAKAKAPATPAAAPAPSPAPEEAADDDDAPDDRSTADPEDDYADYQDEYSYEDPAYEDPKEATPAERRENRPRAAGPAERGRLPTPRLNRREVIGIASFGVVIMIAAVWVLSHFFTQLSFTRESDGKPSYPLKGQLARVASAATFWREPVRDGENRDVARREVVLIPVLELTLDPEQSGGGALRVIFRNSEGQPLGDPITRSFGAGRFESSGSATVSFTATDGFVETGDFEAYRTGKGKLWTADVLEGPPGDSPANAFKKLSSIPILPDRR